MANDSRFYLSFGEVFFGESVILTVTHPSLRLTKFGYRFKCSLPGLSETREWELTSDELELISDSDTETVYNWTVPAEIAEIIPHSKYVSGTLFLHVDLYIGGDLATEDVAINSYPLKVSVPDSMKPSISLTITPYNENTKLQEWDIFVLGKSGVNYNVQYQAQHGTTLKRVRFSMGLWVEQAMPSTVTAESIGTFDVLEMANAATASATDDRGLVNTVQQFPVIYKYDPPVMRDTMVYRCDVDGTPNAKGTYMRVQCAAVCSSLGGRNSIEVVRARLAKYDEDYGDDYIALQNDVETQIAVSLDPDSVYKVELSAIDAVGDETAVSIVGDNPRTAMHMKDGGKGVAFGKKCTEAGFSCAWDASFDGNVIVGQNLFVNGKNFVDVIYPVGSIYLSTSTTSPELLFGGKWEQIKDTFLLSSGDKYSLGNTAGESEVTLLANQMPKHTHSVSGKTDSTGIPHEHYVPNIRTGYSTDVGMAVVESFGNGDGSRDVWTSGVTGTNHIHEFSATSDEKGGGVAHNNMPPYLVVNVWKRTA